MTTPLGKTKLSESRQPQLYAAYSITYAPAAIAVGRLHENSFRKPEYGLMIMPFVLRW